MFETNHLIKYSNTVSILPWKSVIFVILIITLVSSAERIGREMLFKIVSKSFIYEIAEIPKLITAAPHVSSLPFRKDTAGIYIGTNLHILMYSKCDLIQII
jgi:hypothetical protein